MATNPMYSPHLEYAPTFKWGGREWGVNDRAAFEKYLRRRGRSYEKWASRHRNAAKVFDPVEGDIYAMFQPELTGIEAERNRRREYYDRQMKNLGGFYAALGGMLGGIGPAIRNVYGEGAETMAASGTGYGHLLNQQGQTNAMSINDVLSGIEGAEGQKVSGGDPGGVLAGMAGWLPEQMMRAQGGAYGKAADELPHTAGLEAQLMMRDLLRESTEEDQDFSTEILKLLQGLPGARSKLRGEADARRQDEAEFALKKLKEERDWYLDQAKLAMAAGDDKRADRYLKLAQDREARMRAASAGYDAYGNPKPGYHIGADGLVHPDKKPKSETGSTSSTVPGTPAYNAAQVKAVGKARKDVDAYITKNLKVKVPGSYPAEYTTPPYEEAFTKLMSIYGYLGTTPTAKKRLKKMLRDALAAAGIVSSTGGAVSKYPDRPGGH